MRRGTFGSTKIMQGQRYDAIVIGGGIFGCYAALFLARQGRRVCLLEQETQLFRKASLVNQARLHSGYHYPRSLATAAMSDEHKARFTDEHRDFVNFSFEKYYAIDRFGSFTDSLQFERFCDRIGIRCERLADHPLFNFDRLEALYLTEEYSFDPVLLGQFYRQQIDNQTNIEVEYGVRLQAAHAEGEEWRVHFSEKKITAPLVINATYASSNAVNRVFGLADLDLTHEISEMAFVSSPQLGQRGLTVMDGPFGSIMPYGQSGLLSMSSVAYTHHKISYDRLPTFDCQSTEAPTCLPDRLGICTTCPRRPASHVRKMLGQLRQYFAPEVHFDYWMSYFTVKSKLKASQIDDGRPTEVARLHDAPAFFCLFAGKINSIYEVEKVV
jgi:glycine/D-amino acid oxidase-like deaminating enzyme